MKDSIYIVNAIIHSMGLILNYHIFNVCIVLQRALSDLAVSMLSTRRSTTLSFWCDSFNNEIFEAKQENKKLLVLTVCAAFFSWKFQFFPHMNLNINNLYVEYVLVQCTFSHCNREGNPKRYRYKTHKNKDSTKFDWNENFMLEIADGEDNDFRSI